MNSDSEILDEFGRKVVKAVYDDNLRYLKQIISNTTKWGQGKEFIEAFDSVPLPEKETLFKFYNEQIRTGIFSFLSIFENDENFKLVYEKNGVQVDLNEISEMLKAEPIIENGWIDRFSDEIN